MKNETPQVVVQIQPCLIRTFDDRLINELRAHFASRHDVQGIDVQRGEDAGAYINLTFLTPDPKMLWPALREKLVRLGLQGASIVTCTGPNGWDDYVQLHHFNADVRNERL